SWPGYVFTGDPLRLPAGHFGLGHGSGAHAPEEYYLIESATPKVQGLDGAVRSYVEYQYEVARVGRSTRLATRGAYLREGRADMAHKGKHAPVTGSPGALGSGMAHMPAERG